MFRRLGLSATGMRDIAEEADLSPGILYYYFRGRDEILLFCQERTLERLLATAERAREGGGTHAERLRALLRAHVHCVLDELEGATAHLEVESLPEDLRAPVVEKRDLYEHAVRSLVVEGMEQGEFSPADAALVTRAMLGAVNWTVRWYQRGGPQSVEEIADSLAAYLMRGLLPARDAE